MAKTTHVKTRNVFGLLIQRVKVHDGKGKAEQQEQEAHIPNHKHKAERVNWE